MTKKPFIITGLIAISISILGWQLTSFSVEADQFEKECGSNSCCIAYHSGFDALKTAWAENQQQALDQEKATSDKINDVFEGYNTYKCWSEYLCRAVQYSGYGDPKSALTGLTKEHIGTIPGCQAPEDMGMPSVWANFVNTTKEDWQIIVNTVGESDKDLAKSMSLDQGVFNANAISFIPQCMSDKKSLNKFTVMGDYKDIGNNYGNCMELFSSNFGCSEMEFCNSAKIALVTVEMAIMKDHADQKASALENKLSSIINKMHSMQLQTEYFKTNIQKLDDLYSCSPTKCD